MEREKAIREVLSDVFRVFATELTGCRVVRSGSRAALISAGTERMLTEFSQANRIRKVPALHHARAKDH